MHKIQIINHKRHYLISRRALANIVTSAIILSAVSIMGAMMLAWSNNSLTIQKQQLEDIFSTQMNRINEDLVFENVWFSTTCPGKCINVTLSNIGTLGLNVTEIKFVNGTTLKDLKILYYTNAGIVPSKSFSTNATITRWNTGDDIDIFVFTNRGNQFTTQVIAP